jgi:hypothetical protein
MDSQPPSTPLSPPPDGAFPAAPRAASLLPRLGLLGGLALLLLTRALLVHNDPTDFPLDRNMTSTSRIGAFVNGAESAGLFSSPEDTPEYPFLPIGAWILATLGIPMIAAGRLFSLLASLLTGLALYRLGRRLSSPDSASPHLGLLTLWLFALDPLAIFLGRSLLPDTFMVAAVVWSLVAALGNAAPKDRGVVMRAVSMSLWLIVAILAKLPAVMLAPAAALAFVQTSDLRRRDGWIAVAAAALAAYTAACIWYRLAPWNPLAGLRRISEHTNNIMISLGALWNADAIKVLVSRLILAWTLPGTILALFGWIALQGRPGNRLWINAWTFLSLLAVGLTLQANTYWAYMATPVGCLLAANGLCEIARLGRWPVAVAAVSMLVLLTIDPAHRRVLHDLATNPAAGRIAGDLSDRIDGRTVIFGSTAGDIQIHAGKTTIMISPDYPHQRQQEALRAADYLLAGDMLGHPLTTELFETAPVLSTRDQTYALFGLARRARLGEPLAATSHTRQLNLPLGDALIVHDLFVSKGDPADDELAFQIVYQRGGETASPVPLALSLLHLESREAFPVMLTEAGACFKQWPLPQAQIPDFKEFPVESILYRCRMRNALPRGHYRLQLSRLADRRRTLVLGEPLTFPDILEPAGDAPPPALPYAFDLSRAIWLQSTRLHQAAWLGAQTTLYKLGAATRLWLTVPLPPGRYTLAITGRAVPLGNDESERWPRLLVTQSETRMGDTAPLEFRSPGAQTLTQTIQWGGPRDFFHVKLVNPAESERPPSAFPLYLGDTSRGERAVLIERIELREADR